MPVSTPPRILVDGVAYQDQVHYGVYRVWNSLLREWVKSGFSRQVIVLDRQNSCPDLPGVERTPMHPWNPKEPALDRFRLQRACRNQCADVFVSTWVSGPRDTPSAFLHHDFIPERLGEPPEDPARRSKDACIRRAATHLCVSENTARDLRHYYPEIPPERIGVAHLGVDPAFSPRDAESIRAFRKRHRIDRPYFLLVGERIGMLGAKTGARGYKNTGLFFETYPNWGRRDAYLIVLVGRSSPEPELVQNIDPRNLKWIPNLPDEDMPLVYGGATALVYPSKYEGFGLPVLEALACGCPVITTSLASLPEVGGDAPLYVHPESHAEIKAAMEAVVSPGERDKRAELGLRQSKKFSWERFAGTAAEIFSLAAGRASRVSPVETVNLACRAGWESLRTWVRNAKRNVRERGRHHPAFSPAKPQVARESRHSIDGEKA